MNNKKKIILSGSLLVALFIVIGVSYAVWQMTLIQTDKNIVTTGCFKIEFSDVNPITIDKAYPMTDEEGKSLTPYEFTLTNTCDSNVSYQINLEILNDTTLEDLSYIKMMINDRTPTFLTSNNEVEKTLKEAQKSYNLLDGYLKNNETEKFTFWLWLDGDTPARDEYMNKTFLSKITITTSYLEGTPKSISEQNKDYILSNVSDEDIIEDDGTVDHNLRYIGSNPNNYVLFNNELWRIIGLMNNVLDGDGVLDSRIKLIRSEAIGEYSWDYSSECSRKLCGVNEWSESDVMKILNPGYESESVGGSLYFNKSSGICYVRSSVGSTSCDFTSSGLTESAKKFIGNTLWHTGSNGVEISYNSILTSKFYELEKSDNIAASFDDGTVRTTSWKGMVGLMLPSDYGYATSGGSTTDRETCLNTNLNDWDGTGVTDCKNNNWLYHGNDEWTMMPLTEDYYNDLVFHVSNSGYIGGEEAGWDEKFVFPVVYLKPNVLLADGDGTIGNPFRLELIL